MVRMQSSHCVKGIKGIVQGNKKCFMILSPQDFVGFGDFGLIGQTAVLVHWVEPFPTVQLQNGRMGLENSTRVRICKGPSCNWVLIWCELHLQLLKKGILRCKNTFETFVSGIETNLIASKRGHFPLSAASRPPALGSICCRHRRGPWEDSCRPVD